MHITLLPTDMAAAVSAAATALPSRPAHPILGAMLLETDPVTNCVRISAYDYETSASAIVSPEIADDGIVAVSGRLLAQIAKILPKKSPVTLISDDAVLRIESGRSQFTLPLLNVAEFPKIPTLNSGEFDGRVRAAEFAQAVAYANTAAEKDSGLSGRQHLTGIQLDVADDKMQVVGTDTHRIHWSTVDFDNGGEGGTFSALVPAKVLASVAPAMVSEQDGVMLSMRELFAVDGAGLQRTTALISLAYPPYARVFQKAAVGTIGFDAAELVAALRRAAALHKVNHVRLTPTDDDTVLIRSLDDGEGSAVEEIDAEMAGDPSAVTVNGAYLAEAVVGVRQESITLTMTGAQTPIYGNLNGNPKFAIMPVRDI